MYCCYGKGELIMNYVISTDACADMPVGYEKEHDIPIVPMPYSLKMPKGTLKKLDFIGKANTEFDIVECRTDTTGFIQNMKKFFARGRFPRRVSPTLKSLLKRLNLT